MIRKYKTFDITNSGVIVHGGLYLLFMLGLALGIRGMLVVEQAPQFNPSAFIAALFAAGLGATYVTFRFFELRWKYAKSIFHVSPEGVRFTITPNHPRRSEVDTEDAKSTLDRAVSETLLFFCDKYPAKAHQIMALANGGSVHITDKAPSIRIGTQMLIMSSDMDVWAKLPLKNRTKYLAEREEQLDPDHDGWYPVRGLNSFGESVVLFKDNTLQDMTNLIRHESGHMCLYGAEESDMLHHKIMAGHGFGF